MDHAIRHVKLDRHRGPELQAVFDQVGDGPAKLVWIAVDIDLLGTAEADFAARITEAIADRLDQAGKIASDVRTRGRLIPKK